MSVCVCMDGWMAGWMDGWMDGWMNGWLAGWMDGDGMYGPVCGGARDPESGLIYIYIYVCGKPCFFTNPNHRVKFISFHIHICKVRPPNKDFPFFPHTPPPTMWCLAVILVGLQHAVAVFMYISCHVYIYIILSNILKYSLLYRYSMK